MEKNSLVRKYELVVIVDAKLTSDTKETIRKEVSDLINKHGGKVINSQVWLEKHKFTFDIKKCTDGTYYIINFEAASDVIKKLQPVFKLKEQILRFAFIKVEPKVASKSAPEAVAV